MTGVIRTTSRAVVLVCALVALLGCATAPEEGEASSASVPTAAPVQPAPADPEAAPAPDPGPAATETQPPAPSPAPSLAPGGATGDYAVPEDPADIDLEYVQHVLEAFDELHGAALHALYYDEVAFGDLAFVAPLQAAYAAAIFDPIAQGFIGVVETDWANVVDDPGMRRRHAVELLDVSSTCIHVRVASDFREVVEVLPPTQMEPVNFVVLRPPEPHTDPDALNPTPWQIADEQQLVDGAPEPRCG